MSIKDTNAKPEQGKPKGRAPTRSSTEASRRAKGAFCLHCPSQTRPHGHRRTGQSNAGTNDLRLQEITFAVGRLGQVACDRM